jgi:serine/threonine protein kinase
MSSWLVGPYTLIRPIARGGMGEVWEARHRDVPIAMKFLSTPDSRARSLFAEEVRAHASLRHPHILDVLDLGRITHQPSEHHPRIGTPWIALELASGGTLTSLQKTLDWNGTRVVLLAILDALAHAHAHGVVHRDLKPGNVLLSGPTDLRPGLKLADFGIAHRLTRAETAHDERAPAPELIGTPTVMAPEQCRGATRELGPWTDLYALGCIATRLVSGRWPFAGLRGPARLLAHLRRSPKPIAPRFDVPSGFADWVRRALAKDPADRWRCAAHAMEELLDLEPDGLSHPIASPALEASRMHLSTTRSVKNTWRRPLSTPSPAPLVQAGLQLFPLRHHATTGREVERDAIWNALDRVVATRQPHCIAIAGSPGAGSTHLARWATIAPHVHGRAHTSWSRCSADDAPDRALQRLIDAVLRTHGLVGEDRTGRLRQALAHWGVTDEPLVQALESVLAGSASHAVRRGAVRRLLCDLAGVQPMVVGFAHAGTALDVLRFIQVTLANPVAAPLLFVLDLGDTALAGRHAEVFDALIANDRAEVLRLGPLTQSEADQLASRQIPLTRMTLHDVWVQTEGWPGRIVNRLRDLARSRLLVATPHGFELDRTREESASLRAEHGAPAMLESLLQSLPEAAWPILLRAAVLGSEVEADEWARVCDDPTGTAPPYAIPLVAMKTRVDVLDQLTRNAFAVDDDVHSWHFVEPTLRDAILQRARDEGTLAEAHADVARYLDVESDRPRRHHRRIAHHRAAGHLHEALAAALDGIEHDDGHRLEHIASARSLVDALGLPDDDPRRGFIDAWHLRCLHTRDVTELTTRARTLLTAAEQHDWPVAAVCARSWLALCLADPADPRLAEAHLATLDATLDTLPRDSELVLVAESTAAEALWALGRYGEYLARLASLIPRAHQLGFQTLHTRMLAIDALVRTERQLDVPPLDTLLERAAQVEATGDHASAHILYEAAAQTARVTGNLDASTEAIHHSRSLAALFQDDTQLKDIYLGVTALLRGDSTAVRRHLDRTYAAPASGWRHRLLTTVLELGWAVLSDQPSTPATLAAIEAQLPPDPSTVPIDVVLALRALDPRLAGYPDLQLRLRALLSRVDETSGAT